MTYRPIRQFVVRRHSVLPTKNKVSLTSETSRHFPRTTPGLYGWAPHKTVISKCALTMPDEKRRVIIEKSSTVRRRYQRSNKVFRFSAEELKRIEREEAREKRARELREKEKRRIANKKKKAEQDARLREEQRRQGPPDPESLKFPSSQQLLSRFMTFTKKPPQPQNVEQPEQPAQPEHPEQTKELQFEAVKDSKGHNSGASADDGNDDGNAGGDTEIDSDGFDDLDEELEREMSTLERAGPSNAPEDDKTPDESLGPHTTIDTGEAIHEDTCQRQGDEDDEFSDCSVFNDEGLLKEADAAGTSRPNITEQREPPSDNIPAHPRRQPPAEQLKLPPPGLSLGSSFRDETADFLEDVFARGCGDSFSELIQADIKPL
ncbi:hypothetical protein N7468_005200 [Penicillium chermesinum]|uniref:Uncharacterized protein n=1 Tax=Penicillium chermesinum TaxID=63820 RepID=A0A9W9NYU2_9EURO|nr:uncharacterized protein N7468_005200 [Penicillium chermesinum]KAJ5232244.1 hypothetical protein N7468_005200 [Penicillium chermesinum]